MFFAASTACEPSRSAAITGSPAPVKTPRAVRGGGARAATRSVLPVTWVANRASSACVAIDTDLLKSRMRALGMTASALSTLMGCRPSSVERWVSGERRVPGKDMEQLAAAVVVAPERLVIKPKIFQPHKFDHYLMQRRVSVEKLLASGRFERYSSVTIHKWRRGIFTPSKAAVMILERGLALKADALTDGPLEDVPAFTPAEIGAWSESDRATDQGAGISKARPIKDVLRSCRESLGVSWDQFSSLIPGYSSSTVRSWLGGASEPSEQGIAVLQQVLKLSPESLVKRYTSRLPFSVPEPVDNRTAVPPAYETTAPAMALKIGADLDRLQCDGQLAPAIAADEPVAADELAGLIPLVFEVLAQDVRTPRQWNDTFDYLIPHLVVKLPGWPPGRDVRIDSSEGKQLRTGDNADPAPVLLYRHQGTYYGVDYGQPVSVTSDGDGFFRALLISMGHAVSTLADELSLGGGRSEGAVIAALRSHLALYVMAHPEQVAPLLYAGSL